MAATVGQRLILRIRRGLSVAWMAVVVASSLTAESSRSQPPVPIPAIGRQQSARHVPLLVHDSLWSQALGTRKSVLVWLPPSYGSEPGRRFPVAYYLHGAFGRESDWTTAGRLDVTLDSLVAAGMPEMIVVMPDGDDGFYTTWNFLGDYAGCRRNRPPNAEPADTYCVPWPHYDDYIARDLVGYIDRSYRTMPDRGHRGIAGLSMGGYGAVTLALSYPDVFSSAVSHSGVLAPSRGTDRAPVPVDRFDLDSLRASYPPALWALQAPVFGKDSASWIARDPAHLAGRLETRDPKRMPALRVDCGESDMLLGQNRAFRDAMARLGIPVEYAEYPGAHTWDYWRLHSAASAAWLARRLSVP